MSGVIDTNLLLYAVNDDAPEHEKAFAFLTEAGHSGAGWYLTEGIVYEFLRVSTHPRVFGRPLTSSQALSFLRPFLQSSRFSILAAGPRHWAMLDQVLGEERRASGNLFFDLRTVVLMREHGVRRIYTADTDFLRFPSVEVVNPVAGATG
ncbi:MAG TPA: TA system VapC family ribonuclease toxin [Quisquiliibacterium sp.]|nr:TA system VapC family ribonuclease toxin [Quisquiliibacterium sp.]